jgi:mannose/cellobiose epimerase-like protein (N-acyl-D-glucosamine 2-epimerase family)
MANPDMTNPGHGKSWKRQTLEMAKSRHDKSWTRQTLDTLVDAACYEAEFEQFQM